MSHRDQELPILHACYEFITWLMGKTGKFPRDLRFTLGERIEKKSLTIIEGLIRARFAADRVAELDRVNVDVEVLRYLLRIAHELRVLPTKAYGDAAGKLIDIGQQLGAWRKATGRKRPT